MIQARYDQTPAVPASILVNITGMVQGMTAKYWLVTRRYPNGYWVDFTLTPEGKKVLKLASGGDAIQWRPDNPSDPQFSVIVMPLVANQLKASDVGQIQPVGDSRIVSFTENVDLEGVPAALGEYRPQSRQLTSSSRHATFVLTNGAWTLQSIE